MQNRATDCSDSLSIHDRLWSFEINVGALAPTGSVHIEFVEKNLQKGRYSYYTHGSEEAEKYATTLTTFTDVRGKIIIISSCENDWGRSVVECACPAKRNINS